MPVLSRRNVHPAIPNHLKHMLMAAGRPQVPGLWGLLLVVLAGFQQSRWCLRRLCL